ncbi:hypothetical protein IMG5_143840 [Ichthyophthirius multifiliis]|uniref:Uncharacterized protein n=1 Tax=Ichthyophthirius multifiliis TaxID=5932 RepID=G0QXL8_ICHMU|nr:hypothetical protein IMG5_143840 [Ichthyophthirius multifiliis]EGR30048.1 hypothetical protein IMG5_143840 [Ichthyophthirius multifiliis]|eukprot:XP_004031284.1 hypothetical protein IMG5_143840 [Ichthyophthirius multifiliis]
MPINIKTQQQQKEIHILIQVGCHIMILKWEDLFLHLVQLESHSLHTLSLHISMKQQIINKYYQKQFLTKQKLGHVGKTPRYDLINNYLSGEEKSLNQQILHRQEKEHQLDNYVSLLENCDLNNKK